MTGHSLDDVPNQPKTPQKTVRVPDDVWERAKRKAARRGESVSAAVRRFLEEYANGDDGDDWDGEKGGNSPT